ncbi:hypothetical protein ACQPZX_24495 [Actinoplanes sp. CA-142083]|uniref:hypothetical protein n=1 Tax=Actinoplanes sp. CA-142083 TaxID=3239903 RepID=UPI003D90AD99
MTRKLRPGPDAEGGPAEAAYRTELTRTELSRIREAATAWRNGLAGLLTALAGFSLIKGRSDISQLRAGWAVAVGVLLGAATLVGVVAALLLIRAANGNPKIVPARGLGGKDEADHAEAAASAKALYRGRALLLACTVLLAGAVGVTWYGPPRTRPVQVTTPGGVRCGTPVRLVQGDLVLKSLAGEVTVDLATADALKAVDVCPP